MTRKKVAILWICTVLASVLAGMMMQSVPWQWADQIAGAIAIISVALWFFLGVCRNKRGNSMFERYTEKARRAIFFARYESSEFGSNVIETDFLLLGILREDGRIGLRWLGVQAGDLRETIRQQYSKGDKVATSVDLPLSGEAKRVLAYAAEEADRMAHTHIGTEHLFLGMLHEPDCLAFRMVKSRGEDLNSVRAALLQGAQGFEVRPPNAPSRGIQVRLVDEDGGEFAVMQWQGRPPNIGEAISLPDPEDIVSTWRILDLNWRVKAEEEEFQVAEILLKVRREQP